MKKTLHILALILLAMFTAEAQSTAVKQNLSPTFSVTFPVAPQKIEKPNAITYAAKGKDSVGCVATILDFVNFGIDSAALAPLKETQEFAEGFTSGLVKSLPGYTFTPVTLDKWKGQTAYKLSGTHAEKKLKLQMLCIIIGTKMYGLTYAQKEDNNATSGQAFFNTAKIEP